MCFCMFFKGTGSDESGGLGKTPRILCSCRPIHNCELSTYLLSTIFTLLQNIASLYKLYTKSWSIDGVVVDMNGRSVDVIQLVSDVEMVHGHDINL